MCLAEITVSSAAWGPAAVASAGMQCPPGSWRAPAPDAPSHLCCPAVCAATVAADAYAECYPSYYDHGTVLEDSDEEGARPEAEQVRRHALCWRICEGLP